MTISVIIPTFNSLFTISRCLESIFKQTFKNFEIIIIDNLSSDNTISHIKNLFNNYQEKFIIIEEKDYGIYDAMNKGIKIANGKYIIFLGSDDYLYDESIFQKIFGIDQIETYDFIYGNVVFNNTNEIGFGKMDIIALANRNIPHQAIFYKKTIFQSVGQYNLKYKIWADWDLNLKIFNLNGVKILFVPFIISVFNTSGTSGIVGSDKKFQKDFPRIIRNYFSKDFVSFYQERLRLKRDNYNRNKLILYKDKLISELLSNFLIKLYYKIIKKTNKK